MKRERVADIHFIEDSEDEVFISRLLLKSQNVDVNVVHYPSYDAFIASRIAPEPDRPVILFVDLNLPEIKGTEIIRRIHDSGKYPHVVSGICTGSEDPADRLSADKVGARFFIQKPLDLNALQRVCGVIEGLEIVKSGAVLRLQSVSPES